MKRIACVITLGLMACLTPSEPDLGGMPVHDVELHGSVALTAAATIQNDSVLVTVIVTNSGTAPGGIDFGFCSFAVRGASRTHSWDNRLPPNAGCPDVGLGLEVPAGAARQRQVFSRPRSELRPTGTAREYSVILYYRDDRDAKLRSIPAGTIAF